MNEQLPQPLPDILDVEPPVALPEDPLHWGWWLGGALLLILLAFVLWRLFRHKKDTVETPKARALRRLNQLQEQVSHMDGYQFGVVVSDILRTYLTEAHGLHASQQTSREFLEELERENRFSEIRQERLRAFLHTCDFLKYAPAGKATEPNRELLEQSNFFIREDTA